jgi:hypothetical protein
MYNNIGSKIKALAWIECILGSIACVIIGLFFWEREYAGGTAFSFIVLGPLLSWLLSLVTYGFGELIEKTQEIAKNTKITARNTATQDVKATKPPKLSD